MEIDYKSMAGRCNLPFAELSTLARDEAVLNMFTVEALRKNSFVPLRIEDDILFIASARPLDINAMSLCSHTFGGRIDVTVVSLDEINSFLESISAAAQTQSALGALSKERQNAFAPLSDVIDDNPTVQLVDSIIREALPCRASDIHIEPSDTDVRVRYRIDGDLVQKMTFDIADYPGVSARIKILSNIDIAEHRVPQDGRINKTVGGKEYDFRVSTLPTIHGEKFVIRVLDKATFSYTRSELGFTDIENAVVDKMLKSPHGIILLTGPAGCGKSTTLYSFLKEVNRPEVNIITVEDPVEYIMDGITQTQVNAKANLTFATALRSILRQDPDVIMIGEIRDEETAEIAVRAAITGHLVLSTLHTNDAVGAVTRLEDMGVPDYLVADALDGVIAQRLVKTLCPKCKTAVTTTPEQTKLLGLDSPHTVYKPCGCSHCGGTGYRGRTAVHEILHITDAIRGEIARTKSPEALRETAASEGLVTLFDACKKLVLDGRTSISELLRLIV